MPNYFRALLAPVIGGQRYKGDISKSSASSDEQLLIGAPVEGESIGLQFRPLCCYFMTLQELSVLAFCNSSKYIKIDWLHWRHICVMGCGFIIWFSGLVLYWVCLYFKKALRRQCGHGTSLSLNQVLSRHNLRRSEVLYCLFWLHQQLHLDNISSRLLTITPCAWPTKRHRCRRINICLCVGFVGYKNISSSFQLLGASSNYLRSFHR